MFALLAVDVQLFNIFVQQRFPNADNGGFTSASIANTNVGSKPVDRQTQDNKETMNFILRLKHWQVFLILIVGLFIGNFEIKDNQTLTTTLLLIGMTTYFAWILLVGHALYQLLPEKIELNYNLFLINSFIWLTSYIVVMAISDGQGMTFSGVEAIPGFYVFFAFLYFLMFPARTLKSIEKDRKADIGECIGDFFLIVFLPIGIWFLQPRINKVTADKQRTE